jgi:hypothetical protein
VRVFIIGICAATPIKGNDAPQADVGSAPGSGRSGVALVKVGYPPTGEVPELGFRQISADRAFVRDDGMDRMAAILPVGLATQGPPEAGRRAAREARVLDLPGPAGSRLAGRSMAGKASDDALSQTATVTP